MQLLKQETNVIVMYEKKQEKNLLFLLQFFKKRKERQICQDLQH
nr:MAG TPA: hypothetical protein [Caudoviricetes sp.]